MEGKPYQVSIGLWFEIDRLNSMHVNELCSCRIPRQVFVQVALDNLRFDLRANTGAFTLAQTLLLALASNSSGGTPLSWSRA